MVYVYVSLILSCHDMTRSCQRQARLQAKIEGAVRWQKERLARRATTCLKRRLVSIASVSIVDECARCSQLRARAALLDLAHRAQRPSPADVGVQKGPS